MYTETCKTILKRCKMHWIDWLSINLELFKNDINITLIKLNGSLNTKLNS